MMLGPSVSVADADAGRVEDALMLVGLIEVDDACPIGRMVTSPDLKCVVGVRRASRASERAARIGRRVSEPAKIDPLFPPELSLEDTVGWRSVPDDMV